MFLTKRIFCVDVRSATSLSIISDTLLPLHAISSQLNYIEQWYQKRLLMSFQLMITLEIIHFLSS